MTKKLQFQVQLSMHGLLSFISNQIKIVGISLLEVRRAQALVLIFKRANIGYRDQISKVKDDSHKNRIT